MRDDVIFNEFPILNLNFATEILMGKNWRGSSNNGLSAYPINCHLTPSLYERKHIVFKSVVTSPDAKNRGNIT